MQKNWMKRRAQRMSDPNRPSFTEAMQRLANGRELPGEGSTFQRLFSNSYNTQNQNNTQDLDNTRASILAIDSPIPKGANFCRLINTLGLSSDCESQH